MMATWWLVQFQSFPGGWKSPPLMEAQVQAKQCLQCRFDNASGVSLIKLRRPGNLPIGTKLNNPDTEIGAWLAVIPRKPKGRLDPMDPTSPMQYMTAAEEEAEIKWLAMTWE